MIECVSIAQDAERSLKPITPSRVAGTKANKPARIFNWDLKLPKWDQMLTAKSKLAKDLDRIGPILDWQFDLSWTDDTSPSATTFKLILQGEDSLNVEIVRRPSDTPPATDLKLTSSTGLFLVKTLRPVSAATLPYAVKDGHWVVRYRYGMITVEYAGEVVASGFPASASLGDLSFDIQCVAAVRLEQTAGECRLAGVRLEGRTTPSPTDNLGLFAQFASGVATMKRQFSQGKFELSLKQAAALEPLATRLSFEDSPEVAALVSHQGMCLASLEKLEEAERAFRRAARLTRRFLSDRHPFSVLMGQQVASCRQLRGDLSTAAEINRWCDGMMRQLGMGETPNGIRVRANLASALKQQGHTVEAAELYDECLPGFRQLKNSKAELAFTLSNAALCRFDRISRYGCVDLKTEIRDLVDQLRECARLVEKLPQKASLTDPLALRVMPWHGTADAVPQSQANLAAMLIEAGEFDEAEQILSRLKARPASPLMEGLVHHNLGTLQFRRGKFAESRSHYEAAYELLKEKFGPDSPDALTAQSNVAMTYFVAGDDDAAMQRFADNANRLDQFRLQVAMTGWERSAFTAQLSPRMLLALHHARKHRPVEAWQEWEASLARGLLDDLQIASMNSAADPAANAPRRELVEIDRGLRSNLELTDAKRKELIDRRQELSKSILTDSQKGLKALPVIALRDLQALIPADTALVGWVDLRISPALKTEVADQSWAVVVRSSGDPKWIPLTVGDNLAERRLRLMLASRNSPLPDIQSDLDAVREACWAPLKTALEGVRQVVVMTSPRLEGVPIELIAAGDGAAVTYAPSGSVFAELAARRANREPATDKLLAIGSPAFDGNSRLSELPASRKEIEEISRMFEGRVTQRLDKYANLKFLRGMAKKDTLSGFGFIHFATHSAHQVGPFQASLFLSTRPATDVIENEPIAADAGGNEDCLLASEVLEKWRLNAECTTLSACETNVSGDYLRGEGHLGLPYAFLAAGSRTVVASRWKVDDNATRLLMVRFYENLLGRFSGSRKFGGQQFEGSQRMPVGVALAEAQNWLRTATFDDVRNVEQLLVHRGLDLGKLDQDSGRQKSQPPSQYPYEHPYYWASFMVIGDHR
jgi:CHAT domain-containing protein/tetratricopeptide (TPR) repeat protein